jgi:hypothetical protein
MPPHIAESLRLSVTDSKVLRGSASQLPRLRFTCLKSPRHSLGSRKSCDRKGAAFPQCAAAEPQNPKRDYSASWREFNPSLVNWFPVQVPARPERLWEDRKFPGAESAQVSQLHRQRADRDG